MTVVNVDDSFMPREDQEIAELVKKDMSDRGIEFLFSTPVNKLEDKDGKVSVDLGGREVEFNAVLVATGRVPNTSGLKVENAHVELTERKAVKVDENLKSSVDHIYAMGDVVGGLQFTYISLEDYRILVQDDRNTKNRKNVPYTVFIDPPLSRVGQVEADIKSEHKVAKLMAGAIPKTHILRNKQGLLKVIVDSESDLILGAHLYCEDSYEMINLIKLAMDEKIKYQVLRDNIYTHPTMTEALNDLLSTI